MSELTRATLTRATLSRATLVLFVLVTAAGGTGGSEDASEAAETTLETSSDDAEGGATTTVGQVVSTTTQDRRIADSEGEGKTAPVRPTRNVAYPPVMYDDSEDTSPYATTVYDLRVNPHLYVCQPTPTLEAFPELTDPTQEYIIPAVRIGRCNGCNCGNYRSCQPTAEEPVTFQVEVKHYKAKNKRGSVVTTLEEVTLYNHTACRCMCKQQCSTPRVLNPDTCTCVCAQKTTCPRYFVWTNARCTCQCNPKQVPCAKPKVVDQETCQCRDRTEADGNRTQQKRRPTEVDDVNNPSVAREDVISY